MPTDRRKFVTGVVGATSLIALSCKTTGAGSSTAASNSGNRNAANGGRVRRSVWDLDPNGPELNDYRKAIKAMSALPRSDQRSWENQANVHNNSCPHSNWFFVTWHRAYLYYFEQLIQKYSGNPDFSLPYWDWSKRQQLPPAFTSNSGGNPLFHPGRSTRALSANSVGPQVIRRIMSTNDFQSFAGGRASEQRGDSDAGILEATPHNYVHSLLGGDMGTFMSPRDPIFWLHHCNVDRIWAMWADAHPETNLPSDPAADDQDNAAMTRDFWLNFSLSGYYDTDGNPATAKPSDTLSTGNYGYSYDTSGVSLALTGAVTAPRKRETVTYLVQNSTLTRTDDHVTFAIPVDQGLTNAFNLFQQTVQANPGSACVRLKAANIPVPGDLTVQIRVFLNHPALDANVSDDDPHFVGRCSFFSAPHAGHGGVSRRLAFELNPVIAQLFKSAADLGAALNFQVQVAGDNITALPSADYFQPIQLSLQWVTFA